VKHGRLYLLSERGFDYLLAGYRRALDFALFHHRATFHRISSRYFSVTHRVSFVTIPKGFFPQQDTGLIIGHRGRGAGYFLRRDDAPRPRYRRCRDEGSGCGLRLASVLERAAAKRQNNARLFVTLKPAISAMCLPTR